MAQGEPTAIAGPAAWQRHLVVACAVAALAVIFWRSASAPVPAFDAWWDWRAGESSWLRLREEGSLPPTGSGWLGQVLVYLASLPAGAAGVAFLGGVIGVSKASIYLLAFRRVGRSLLLAVVGVALLEFSRWSTSGVLRPQTLAECCWAVLLFGCAHDQLSRTALWAVPLLVALWANLHGSFPLAFLLLAVLLIDRFVEQAWQRKGLVAACEEIGVRRLAAVLGLALAAVCVNPAGPRPLIDAMRASRQGVSQAIVEWQAINLPQVGGLPFLVSLLLVLATLRFSPRHFRLSEAVLLLLFGLGAWFSAGFVFWWATVWPLILLPHWKAIQEEWTRQSEDAQLVSAPRFVTR